MLTCGFSQRLINPAPGSSIPGDFKPPVSLGVHDDLMTKVVYFNDGEKSALIVVADFVEMFRSDVLPSIRLTEIFRQAQQSLIVVNAHRVNRGELPQLRDVKNDFFFLPGRSEEGVGQTIVGLCAQRLPQNMGIQPWEIQVLSPTKKGAAGTVNLNRMLQASLNPPAPGKKERAFGEVVFREGDRVMQIRNNYDILWKKQDGSAVGTGIFNGDVGFIRSIDPDMEVMTIIFDDREVEYDFTMLNELELAYAVTVHNSQGSE